MQQFWRMSDHSRLIDFQDSSSCGKMLLPVSDWMSHFLQKVNFVDISQFMAAKTNVHHIRILLPVSISVISPQSAWHFALVYLISSKLDHLLRKITSFRFFRMADAAAQYYFRFPTCWCSCIRKVKIYHQTKFRPDISIYGWDITNSVFVKQTFAILEFYFRFPFRSFRRNLHGILH